MRSALFGLATILVLGGCTVVEKSVNYIATSMTDGDCDMKRTYQGKSLCRTEKPPPPAAMRTVYCYRSLGDVECFDKPLANRQPISEDTVTSLPPKVDG